VTKTSPPISSIRVSTRWIFPKVGYFQYCIWCVRV
jgi:hypothetical protein